MARPLRLEFPGAFHLVTSRGDRREAIYPDEADRLAHLQAIGATIDRFEAKMPAYCRVGNHHHRIAHTPHDVVAGAGDRAVGVAGKSDACWGRKDRRGGKRQDLTPGS